MLFFEILGQFEDEYHAGLLEAAAQASGSPHHQVKDVLMRAFTIWRTNPLFTNFIQEEFEYLARKLPEELIQANLNKDEVFVGRLLEQWRQRQRPQPEIEPPSLDLLDVEDVVDQAHEPLAVL